MAYHFDAHQFEHAYDPKRLRNWQVPKCYPLKHPRTRTTTTKIIADDRGHLLDGVKKDNPWGNFLTTWDYPNRITREIAKQISYDKRCAHAPIVPEEQELQQQSHLPQLRQPTCQSESFQRRNRSSSALDINKKQPKKQELVLPSPTVERSERPPAGTLEEKYKKILETEERLSPDDKIDPKLVTSLPTKWEEKQDLPQEEVEADKRQYFKSLDEHIDRYQRATDEKQNKISEEIDFDQIKHSSFTPTYTNLLARGRKLSGVSRRSSTSSRKSSTSSRKMARDKNKKMSEEFSQFQIAKRYHEDNLKHHPLPDMIDNPVFKALESTKHPYPGIALPVEPNASAIGWKGYGAPGPTKCSKLKVYRPKTAADPKIKTSSPRPKTTASVKHFTQMDLAICWDLKPNDPTDEPKRSPHIDGSNGSAAPAVFAVVHPAEKEFDGHSKILGSAQAVAEHIPRTVEDDNVGTLPSKIKPVPSPKAGYYPHVKSNAGAIMNIRKDSGTSFHSLSPKAAEIARLNPKTAWTEHDTSKVITERLQELKEKKRSGSVDSKGKELEEINLAMSKKKQYQSSPNLAAENSPNKCSNGNCNTPPKCSNGNCNTPPPKCTNGNCNTPPPKCTNGNCNTPDKKNVKRKDHTRNCQACDKTEPDSEYKPKIEYKQAFKAGVPQPISSFNTSNSAGAKPVKMPKLRPPYSKRTYSIGTLAPPFSVWPDNHGQDYPEHWRLASVYQHSFKPVEQRRKHLLASVYQ